MPTLTISSNMNCEILETSNPVLLTDEEVSLQSVPLTIDEDKSNVAVSPPQDNLIPETAVLLQTENGLTLLSMSDCMSGITYSGLVSPSALPDSANYSFLVNCDADSLVQPAPPQFDANDTRALDKFPDLPSTLHFDTPTSDSASDKLMGTLHLTNEAIPDMTQAVEMIPVLQEAAATAEPKKKGGWPKGRKRKIGLIKPKAPSTAFVLFSTKRRSEIKTEHPGLNFSETNKILGSEWSLMSNEDKQPYMDQSEADKRRYINELKQFKKSDKYQEFVKRKKLKAISGVEPYTEEDITEICEDLYCGICDQYFSSAHNKTEHMFGNKHLQAVTGEMEKELQEKKERDEALSNPGHDPSVVDPSTSRLGHFDGSLDIAAFTMMFYEKNIERELEIQQLHKSYKDALQQYTVLFKNLEQCKSEKTKLADAVTNMKSSTLSLASQINSLTMLPRLFGILNL